jgi:hypothetical protein
MDVRENPVRGPIHLQYDPRPHDHRTPLPKRQVSVRVLLLRCPRFVRGTSGGFWQRKGGKPSGGTGRTSNRLRAHLPRTQVPSPKTFFLETFGGTLRTTIQFHEATVLSEIRFAAAELGSPPP